MERSEFTNIFKELGKKNIAIMGHMGSGKSLTGKILAKQLGFQHLDSDLEIIKLTNKSINQIKVLNYIKKFGHIVVQKFIPQVTKGDKRVFIINGLVKGAIQRVPRKGSFVSNLAQGGKAIKTKLNYKELKISQIVAKHLKKSQIFFAGIDLVSNYLIGDINVTSPTGLKNFKDLSGINLAKDFWNNLEKLK